VRDTVTALLEVAGLLLLVAAATVWVWRVTPAAGLAVAGAGLLGVAALLAWLARP